MLLISASNFSQRVAVNSTSEAELLKLTYFVSIMVYFKLIGGSSALLLQVNWEEQYCQFAHLNVKPTASLT